MTVRAGSGAGAQPVGFTPRITVGDPLARLWLAQATLRLRREVAWLWHERGTVQGIEGGGTLPPLNDPLHDALDLARHDVERNAFFASDPTARYLSDRIAALVPDGGPPRRGGFGWLAAELALEPVECFVLALALGGTVDAARGAVVAACLNTPEARDPTLALAQRLWDLPEAVLPLLDPGHRLFAAGILPLAASTGWDAPLSIPPVIARQLLFPDDPPPKALVPVAPPIPAMADEAVTLTAARLRARSTDRATLVPLVGPEDAPHAETAAAIAAAAGLELLALEGAGEIAPMLVVAWARRAAVLVPAARLAGSDGRVDLPLAGLPVTLFVPMSDGDRLSLLPRRETLPRVTLAPLKPEARLAAWRAALPEVWAGETGRAVLHECAHRFGIEARAIERVAATVRALDRSIDRDTLFAACRAVLDLGDLAQPVRPRFRLNELMLPRRQEDQIRGLIRALGALGTVHMDWGMARVWNESGLSVLFTGPPGTGKTMAAEAIAAEVGMPMYRIDLSQVVNKYIGETEKNLRRLFDAADSGDAILFFDEADALFGKRTEVKDAHDRYSNLEVSYLLERMERFKGMAILASNRRKDLDEAFLRRLRTIVTFPLPEAPERLRIWQGMMPEGVDCTALDLKFLAERLPLSGGHIRSAIFNACLQSARRGAPPRLEMGALVRAVKDEFDKLGRTVSLDQFGPHAAEIRHAE
ncbi:ATP-binding protein [Pararhodobacter sp. SW119]|uniref:ATP-binding protein n=1 Tax=Pararhodobacter sp. SW119 TaxID=2780075 RepID=UPI001AE055F5|nr:ATP-binding protein [Pararhodobacter sp. SW119]